MTSTVTNPLDEAARKYELRGYAITSRTATQVILQETPYRGAARVFAIVVVVVALIVLPYVGPGRLKTVILTLQPDGTVRVKKGRA
ncbi:MAG: hypothetical protein EPN91_12370 [Salinibacterium sp.]|nr:MAG: hypothetical protein EPN91_12370 [Salinibacterium sp.]